jgi:hypothetical protein
MYGHAKALDGWVHEMTYNILYAFGRVLYGFKEKSEKLNGKRR